MGTRYCSVCNTHCTGSDIFVFEKTYCPQCVEPVIEKMEKLLKYYEDKENNKLEELIWLTSNSSPTVIKSSIINNWMFNIEKKSIEGFDFYLEVINKENNKSYAIELFNSIDDAILEANKIASFLGIIK